MKDSIGKATNCFNTVYPHYDFVRTGEPYLCDDKTLAVVPIVYRSGLAFSLAVVVIRMYKYHGLQKHELVALDTNIQHIGSDWELSQVRYFFDREYGFTEFPCFAMAVKNDTTEGSGIEGDILLIDPYSKSVVSAAKKIGSYARIGAFLGATAELAKTTNGWDWESAVEITCPNGCRYIAESAGSGMSMQEAAWRVDF
jgi:hypothetical protein